MTEEKLTCREILDFLAAWFDVPAEKIKYESGAGAMPVPIRHICVYLCRRNTTASLNMIARLLKYRDHSTVLYALRAIGKKMASDSEFAATVAMLEQKLYE